jgi:hypothetical protein
MTDKTIEHRGVGVGGDYFRLLYSRKSKYKLDYYLDQFNFDDYFCYKSSGFQKIITYEELLDFRYSGYVFFKKELYDKKHIDLWIDFMKGVRGFQYLTKTLPPFNPYKKIIIK